ncbi:MAG: NADP-dependent isocitrate dehydrogenase, partial [Clostridia bacterium]
MTKILMKTPIVEMDGDEMTRVIWQWIKDIVINPFVELKSEYFDLGLPNREKTKDEVTVLASNAIKKYGVGVKCATITPNAGRVTEYNLSKMWKSPNGTIRAILDGTVFRAPIMVDGVTPYIPNWKTPITIARHAYGDIYKDVEGYVKEGGKAKLVLEDCDGPREIEIFDFAKTAGVIMGMHNTDKSISSFARSCLTYALDTHQDIWFAAKDTISKTYDHRFKDIFQDIFDSEYKEKFEKAGIEYFYTLSDDAVARVIRSNGGFIWACKNYDGDVMSD